MFTKPLSHFNTYYVIIFSIYSDIIFNLIIDLKINIHHIYIINLSSVSLRPPSFVLSH